MAKAKPTPTETTPQIISVEVMDKRVDILFLFDVSAGSPQGDPAQVNNRPREDIDTGLGIITDAGIKRYVRDYTIMAKEGEPGYDIHVRHKAILEEDILAAQDKLNLKGKAATNEAGQHQVRAALVQRFFDIRAFGGVLAHSPEANAGKITGPVQFTAAWSCDPLDTIEIKGTRVAVANQKRSDSMAGFNQDFSVKYMTPYALFKGNCFVSPFWAQKTGFSKQDYQFLIEALKNMFENRRTSSSGLRTTRKIIAFQHDSRLGCAPAADLFDLVQVTRKDPSKPPRAYSDYEVKIDRSNVPAGVEIVEY